jgi:hypothetical protein
MRPPRVRHHTDDQGLALIEARLEILPSRGWGDVASGINVEVEPFGTTRPSRQGKPGPKADLGCGAEGAYVEFDAPPGMVPTYNIGPRNTAIIPMPYGQVLSLAGLNPEFVKVRLRWWQFWRRKPE